LERWGVDYFRWTEPHAAVQLRVPAGDYRLRLDMKELSHHWAGRLDLRLNDRPVPCRERRLEAGVLSQAIHRDDLPPVEEIWLHMTFDPVNTTACPQERRLLGAPLFAVFLDRAG
jgi:hypothetical protein